MNRDEIKIFIVNILKEVKDIKGVPNVLKWKYPNMTKEIINQTIYLPKKHTKITERFYHILNNLYGTPICGNIDCCNKVRFNSFSMGYFKMCSHKCLAYSNNHGVEFNNITGILCSWCKNEAYFLIGSSKPCCSKNISQCETHRKMTSDRLSGENHPFFGKASNKHDIEDIKLKHPEFYKIEELKEEDGNILVKCTVCKKWYIPSKNSFQCRKTALKNGQEYLAKFYCSDKCRYFKRRLHSL